MNESFIRQVKRGAGAVAITLASLAVSAMPVLAADTGFVSPGTTANEDYAGTSYSWGTPSNAVSSDNTYTTSVSPDSMGTTPHNSDYLNVSGFGLSVPGGATIDGIEVTVERVTNSTTVNDVTVQMVKAGSRAGTNIATGTAWPQNSEATVTYGGATSMWGTTWTPAEVNASDFGFSFSTRRASGGGARNMQVDQIRVKVYYTVAGDVTAPAGPTVVGSTSHTETVPENDATIDMSWTSATDGGSGLDGYSYLFDTSASTDPDTVKDIEEGATTVSSSSLADGASHYFHIRAVDNAGNWGTTVHAGPYVVDMTAPIIALGTAIAPVTVDTTPTYIFTADEAGTIAYDSCPAHTGSITSAAIGSNSVTFDLLNPGPYSGCEITVTDTAGNVSNTLTVPNFYVYMGGSSAGGGSIPAVINLYSPNGGESLAPAASHTIYWSTGGSGIVTNRVSLSVNNGSTWTVLAEELTGGSYSWTVPDVATTEAKIRVQAQDGTGFVLATDESDQAFAITGTTSTEEYQETVVPEGDSDEETFVPAEETAASPDINTDKNLDDVTAPENPLCVSGSLIKLASDNNPLTQADSTVYFCGHDGKRYVFPNLNTFHTWFADFSSVVIIDASVLSQIQMGGNITYKPGVRMLKLQTDPKVYAVDNGGVLRWVTSEAVAIGLYGADWATKVDDLSDAYATDYTYGAPIY